MSVLAPGGRRAPGTWAVQWIVHLSSSSVSNFISTVMVTFRRLADAITNTDSFKPAWTGDTWTSCQYCAVQTFRIWPHSCSKDISQYLDMYIQFSDAIDINIPVFVVCKISNTILCYLCIASASIDQPGIVNNDC